jgi:hypothetical protein
MAGLHFLDQVDPTAGSEVGTLDPAPTIGVKLTLEGQTASGQTLSLDDVADALTFRRDGVPFSSESFRFWNEVSRLWFGDVDAPTGNANSQERAVAFVWFYQPEIVQALRVEPDNLRYNMQFNSSALSTRFSSDPTVKIEQVTVKPGELPELYTPYCLQDDLQLSGAGFDTDTIEEPNTTRLFFEDESNLVEDVRIEVDGRTEFENADFQDMNDQARLFNRVETGTPPYVEYTTISAVGQASVFNSRVAYQVQSSGAGTLEVTRMRVGDVADRERIGALIG